MPKCVDCGAETPRKDMYGTDEELRCGNCAQSKRRVYDRPIPPPAKEPIISFLLILLCVGLFGVKWFSPELTEWVGVWLPIKQKAIWSGEVYRFATSPFLHLDEYHLVFNLIIFWILAQPIEGWLGPWRFLLLVLFLGVGSTSIPFLLSFNPVEGISGIVYGLAGLLVALRRRKDFAAEIISSKILVLIFLSLIFELVMRQLHLWVVAAGSHISGLALGFLLGKAILQQQRTVWVSMTVAVVGGVVAMTQFMTWNPRYQKFQELREAGRVQVMSDTKGGCLAESLPRGDSPVDRHLVSSEETQFARGRSAERPPV